MKRLPFIFIAIFAALSPTLRGQSITNNGEFTVFTGATVAVNVTYPGFSAADTVDGSANAFVFNENSGGAQTMSISGFNSSIGSIRFFDTPQFSSRAATGVDIYYSSTNQTSLTAGDYTLLGHFAITSTNGGQSNAPNTVFTTPTTPDQQSTAGEGGTHTISYYTLTGLNIPSGTQSVMFEFSRAFSTLGLGFSEIQAEATAVPEPSTYAAIFGVVACLAVAWRRRALGAAGVREHRRRRTV